MFKVHPKVRVSLISGIEYGMDSECTTESPACSFVNFMANKSAYYFISSVAIVVHFIYIWILQDPA